MTNEQLKRMEDIMIELSDLHLIVSSVKLSSKEYDEINKQFAKVKVALFFLYTDIKKSGL